MKDQERMEDVFSRMQFDRLHRASEGKYVTIEIASREEAERRLDELGASANAAKPEK